jgi:hypothetical protein
MARKLKTYVTHLGFFELALAAPSMKAALDAWGMGHNAFHQGFARETGDPKIVAATMARPGVVLKRPVGSKGAFVENAKLPKDWTLAPPRGGLPKARPKKAVKKPQKPKAAKTDERADKAQRAAVISFEKEKARREREREKEAAAEEAREDKDRARRERERDKAQAAFDRAEARHREAMEKIEAERDGLDRRMRAERERWDEERDARKAALREAGD